MKKAERSTSVVKKGLAIAANHAHSHVDSEGSRRLANHLQSTKERGSRPYRGPNAPITRNATLSACGYLALACYVVFKGCLDGLSRRIRKARE